MRERLATRIVGMEEAIEKVLLCILTGNHALLVGVPGLAKTLLVSSVAELLDLSFARIQFTPDLMPTDITGTEVLGEDRTAGTRTFRFLPGPVFANLVLADEINRTPPKTQAALMEAMEERQVTSVGKVYPLPDPFFVLATQNPIEQEGTYPLPVAQLDRFMFRIRIDYPDAATESRVARRLAGRAAEPLKPVLSGEDIARFRKDLAQVEMPDRLRASVVEFVRKTRPDADGGVPTPSYVKEWVAFGAGPRAAQALAIGGRARALLRGRRVVAVEDILALAPDIVRHRLVLNYHASAEGIRGVDVVNRLMEDHFDLAPAAAKKRKRWWHALLPE